MKNKPVVVWDGFDGSFAGLYPNVKLAAEDLYLSVYALNKIIDTSEKFNRKYITHYYSDDIKQNTTVYPIQQLKDGVVINQFRTITEAVKEIGLSRSTIDRLCKNGGYDKWNCTWKNLRKLV